MLVNAKAQVYVLFQNPILIACIFSWFSAQFIKTVIKLFSGRVHSIKDLFELLLWRTGSMPSSHAALVACLSISIGFHSGFDSDVFVLALCLYLITVRDAVGVRRSSGVQGKVLNVIGHALSEKGLVEYTPVKEVQGHAPMEVVIGSLLGFINGLAFAVL